MKLVPSRVQTDPHNVFIVPEQREHATRWFSMPDIPHLLSNLQRAVNALASALNAEPNAHKARTDAEDEARLLASIAADPQRSWRVYRMRFGTATHADEARNRLLAVGRLAYKDIVVHDTNHRRQPRRVLVIVEREKAPEGAPVPRRILPPGF